MLIRRCQKLRAFYQTNMNRLSLTLDFEEEYRPIDLNFGLTDGSFDIYQHQKAMRISIYTRWGVVQIGFPAILL